MHLEAVGTMDDAHCRIQLAFVIFFVKNHDRIEWKKAGEKLLWCAGILFSPTLLWLPLLSR